MKLSEITTVLFDLDGTISDSAPGILGSMQAAFAEHDIDWLDDATARSLVGPPLRVSLPPLVGADRLESVIASYRQRYETQGGLLNASLYDGIVELLTRLHGRGLCLAVATSKRESLAVEILSVLGVSSWFTVIGGDTLDGARGSKALVVGDVLTRLGSPPPDRVVMVGDRQHDVIGAAVHGVACVGALWGYGDREELEAAGAWAVCDQPTDLLELF